ncbi:MAG: hypothetical protein ABIQ70_12750 [Dokdonella sp.]
MIASLYASKIGASFSTASLEPMKRSLQVSILVSYLVAFWSVSAYVEPPLALYLSSLASFVFALVFNYLNAGPRWVPLLAVGLVTFILPIVGILFIGVPVYHSFVDTLKVAYQASASDGQLHGFEWLLPSFAATVGIIFVAKAGSNYGFNATARKRAAR